MADIPFSYQGQQYSGREIERQVSRADDLMELHVQAAGGEERETQGTPRLRWKACPATGTTRLQASDDRGPWRA